MTEVKTKGEYILFLLGLFFNFVVVYFIFADFLDGLNELEPYKLNIYIALSIGQFIFDLLLRGNQKFKNAIFAITIITGGIIIPTTLAMQLESGLAVYFLYMLYSIVIVAQIPNVGRRIVAQAQKSKMDIIGGILLFLIMPSIFSHLAAFVSSNIRANIRDIEDIKSKIT